MMTLKLKKLFFLLGVSAVLLPCACTEKESDLGVNLQDPFTLYSGVRDTADVSACTVMDDSLLTANYSAGVFGDYTSSDFGSVQSVVYSQIAVTSSTGISLSDEVVIDSVVMTLVIDTVYPVMPDSTPRQLHIIVNQLAEPLRADSAYLSDHQIPEGNNCFFNGTVTFVADSVRLRMNENIYDVLKQTCTQAEFLNITKGLSLRLADHSQMMVTVDFAATNTALTMYYHTATADSLSYVFAINSEAAHSMYYHHDYSASPLASIANHNAPSLAGTERLYLEPLAGTRVRLNLQQFLDNFRRDHPSAVIHYAELLLPVADTTTTQYPVRVMALKRSATGAMSYITDLDYLNNPYTYAGYDGYYHRDSHQYRIRVTRHLQELLRQGTDYGTDLVIDARRSSAFHTVFNGTATANPVRIDFIYSE